MAMASDAPVPLVPVASGLRPVPATLRRGVHVILRDLENSQKVFWLGEGCKDLRMGRYPPIPVEAILGQPYGGMLRRSEGGQWVRHRRACEDPAAASAAAAAEEVYETNQHLAQDNSAQALSPGEVSALKGRCTGEEVVEALASNSATFASKTKFAQEKYLKKKQQKHVQQVLLLRPTLLDLCETYMKTSRNKVCGLRFDYVSSILCQADVRAGGRYFLLDSACGLVAAAMAQQLCGSGQVFRVFKGGCPDKALSELDLGERRTVVRPMPLEVLQCDDPWSLEWLRPPDASAASATATEDQYAAKQVVRKDRSRIRGDDVRSFKGAAVDAVVIVAGDDDAELASEALELGLQRLVPGGRVVVYAQHLQPLATRQASFRASGGFVDVRLHQLFTREYQVLPQRTHPMMTAESMLCEGFVLCASKVVSEAEVSTADVADEALGRKRRRF